MRRWCAPLALAALCLSCTPTPFDLTLSRAARTVEKLTQDNASAIVMEGDSDELDPDTDCVFYPVAGSAGFDYSEGTIAWTEGMYVKIQAVQPGSDGGSWFTYSSQGQLIANMDAHAPAWILWPAKGGSPYLFSLTFDSLYPGTCNRYTVLLSNAATSSTTSTDGALMATTATSLLSAYNPGLSFTVIGASVTAATDAAYDWTHWLARDDSGTGYVELAGEVCGPALTGAATPMVRATTPYALSFLPAELTRCMYYYDENTEGDSARYPTRSFASWYDQTGGTWVCWAWWLDTGEIVSRRLDIPYRLSALLSSGQLLSTEDGTGRLYSRDGALLATFPLGNLAYIGERYVDGTARTYFSQCLVYDNARHFNVYGMETGALASLGE